MLVIIIVNLNIWRVALQSGEDYSVAKNSASCPKLPFKGMANGVLTAYIKWVWLKKKIIPALRIAVTLIFDRYTLSLIQLGTV